jgi:hypothetical protein
MAMNDNAAGGGVTLQSAPSDAQQCVIAGSAKAQKFILTLSRN